jgi:hypothetical protein
VREVGVGDVWRVRASLATGCKELIIALVETVMRAVDLIWSVVEYEVRLLKELEWVLTLSGSSLRSLVSTLYSTNITW